MLPRTLKPSNINGRYCLLLLASTGSGFCTDSCSECTIWNAPAVCTVVRKNFPPAWHHLICCSEACWVGILTWNTKMWHLGTTLSTKVQFYNWVQRPILVLECSKQDQLLDRTACQGDWKFGFFSGKCGWNWLKFSWNNPGPPAHHFHKDSLPGSSGTCFEHSSTKMGSPDIEPLFSTSCPSVTSLCFTSKFQLNTLHYSI